MLSNDIYTLDRNPSESERLNEQSKLLINIVGYVLHPAIEARLPAKPKIAELATGTGTFLVDVAKHLPPDSQIHGTDISAEQFPPRDQLPLNVSLSVVNAKEPVPEAYRGQYDVVNIRYINAAMVPDDWIKVARHAAQMLKPGGAIQWIEADFVQLCRAMLSHPAANGSSLEHWWTSVAKPEWSWFVDNLGGVEKEAGFSDVRRHITSSDRDLRDRVRYSITSVGALIAILKAQARNGAKGALGDADIEDARRDMLKDVASGAYHRIDVVQFIAFKAA